MIAEAARRWFVCALDASPRSRAELHLGAVSGGRGSSRRKENSARKKLETKEEGVGGEVQRDARTWMKELVLTRNFNVNF